MASEAQCPHSQVHYHLNLASFGDTNIRYVEITGKCTICDQPMRFQGMPFGLSPEQPTMSIDGIEAKLPVMFGEEEYDGKSIGFTGSRM
jgi:hypothetical protein